MSPNDFSNVIRSIKILKQLSFKWLNLNTRDCKISTNLKPNGYFFIVTFTNKSNNKNRMEYQIPMEIGKFFYNFDSNNLNYNTIRTNEIIELCESSITDLNDLKLTLEKKLKSNNEISNTDDPEFIIYKEDRSIEYNSKKYNLPIHHFDAVLFIVQEKIKKNDSVNKHTIYEKYLPDNIENEETRRNSVYKWFICSGGEAKKFAKDGLIKTIPFGNCYLNVKTDKIRIF